MRVVRACLLLLATVLAFRTLLAPTANFRSQ